MSKQPATRSWNQPPLGGSSGDWRHRFLRFHVPLALASVLVLVLFMTLPLFDASGGPTLDMGSSGAFPQQRGERGPMDDGGEQAGPMDHGGEQAEPTGHGRGPNPQGHGGGQTSSSDESRSGGRTSGSDEEHGGGQAAGLALSFDPDSRAFRARLTVATGYVALGLLALTLLIGPANLLLRRRNPISSYLARDVGTWATIFSVVHVFFGLQVHGPPVSLGERILTYFVARDGSPLTNSFGLGNWTGLAATVIVVGLLAISSDFALRKLKARAWKRLQRLNYALFALVILHAFFYGALLQVTSPFTLLLLLSVIAVFIGQAVGIWLWRRKNSPTTTSQPA